MKTCNSFKEMDMKKLDYLIRYSGAITRLESYVWNNKDQALPDGWRRMQFGTKLLFLSPENQQFLSRPSVLQYMHKCGYLGAKIVKMRSSLTADGWLVSQNLPNDWMYKTRNAGSSRVTIALIQPDGQILEGSKRAWGLIKNNSLPGEETRRHKVFLENQTWLLGK